MSTHILIPIPKNPYSRIGPAAWQDYYRQIKRTVELAGHLRVEGHDVVIAVISGFQPDGQPSEREIYANTIHQLAPALTVRVYNETNDTVGQIERGFSLARQMAARPTFIATWLHYPRVRYLSKGRPAKFLCAFGLPHPAFLFIDLFCLIAQPIGDLLGVSDFFRKTIIHQRDRGRIL